MAVGDSSLITIHLFVRKVENTKRILLNIQSLKYELQLRVNIYRECKLDINRKSGHQSIIKSVMEKKNPTKQNHHVRKMYLCVLVNQPVVSSRSEYCLCEEPNRYSIVKKNHNSLIGFEHSCELSVWFSPQLFRCADLSDPSILKHHYTIVVQYGGHSMLKIENKNIY